jgi:hypothetical protein
LDLEDWVNADHFPSLGSAHKNPSVAFGLTKHSQPDDVGCFDKMKHHKIPSIAVVDSHSIAVGNLLIQFS